MKNNKDQITTWSVHHMIIAYSWTVYEEEKIAEKVVDRSLKLDRITGIPKDIREFFDLTNIEEKKRWTLYVYYRRTDQFYKGAVTVNNQKTRLTFEKNLINLLRKAYPKHFQFFLDQKLQKNQRSEIEDVRIRFIKEWEKSQNQAKDNDFLGTYEIEFPGSKEKLFQTESIDLLSEEKEIEHGGFIEGKKRMVSHIK